MKPYNLMVGNPLTLNLSRRPSKILTQNLKEKKTTYFLPECNQFLQCCTFLSKMLPISHKLVQDFCNGRTYEIDENDQGIYVYGRK